MYFCLGGIILAVDKKYIIQLLEYPIPQKPSSADISETESGIIDPLVSKQQEEKNINNNWRRKIKTKEITLLDLFAIVFGYLLTHYPIIAPLRGSHGQRPKGVKDIFKQAQRVAT